jgi:hypothetical protein
LEPRRNLLLFVGTLDHPGGFPSVLDGWQHECCQQPDNEDDNQQFYKSKRFSHDNTRVAKFWHTPPLFYPVVQEIASKNGGNLKNSPVFVSEDRENLAEYPFVIPAKAEIEEGLPNLTFRFPSSREDGVSAMSACVQWRGAGASPPPTRWK